MAEGFTLQATARNRTGKGAARELRRNGQIPAVIYGGEAAPQPIAIPYKEAFQRLHQGGFLTHVWTLEVDGTPVRALARDYQLEPVRDFLIHVDFLRVSADTRASVDVPVHFVNQDRSPALKEGAVLEVVNHTVPLDCPAEAIPEHVEIDLAGVGFGTTLTMADIALPAGIRPSHGAEALVIATIAAPTTDAADDAEAEAADGE